MSWRRYRALLVLTAVALPAQDAKVEAEDPALASIRGLLRKVETARADKDYEAARETVRAALKACIEVSGSAERKDAHDLLFEIGRAAYAAADLPSAHDACQRVCDYRTRTLPDDHPDLQAARNNLAATKRALGDLVGAGALFQQVLEVSSRTLPDDHPDLQRARNNLALTQKELGDLAGARALQEKAIAGWSRTLPDDHPHLQAARLNLAATKYALGDLSGARVLQEKVFAVWSRTLPDDHPHLQAARGHLAVVKKALGDLAGARALEEKVLEVCSRALPDDHPGLQTARFAVAATKHASGDFAGAHSLFEKVLEVRGRTLADDHPGLQRLRLNLANTKMALGDPAGARALQEEVLEAWSRSLPDDHPDLQRLRLNLADAKCALGDLSGARALFERVFASWSRTLPDDHPDLQLVRNNLAVTKAMLGDARGALQLACERGAAARRRLSSWILAPRELSVMAAQEHQGVDLLLTLAGGFGAGEAMPDAAVAALMLSQALRGAQTRAARQARSVAPEQRAGLEEALRAAAAEVSRIAGEAIEGEGEALEAKRRSRAEHLSRAVREKERLERELASLSARGGHVDTAGAGAAELAAALPERSAAAAIVGFRHSAPDPGHPGRTIGEARLAALVLDRGSRVQFVPLGAATEVRSAVEALRSAQRTQSGRGLRPAGSADESGEPRRAAELLRRRVIAPLLAACGPVDTLYLSVDDLLELVPLDALPLDRDHLVGERVALRPLVSLLELLEPQDSEPDEAPELLLGGGIDYGRAAEDAVTSVDANAASPVVDRAGEAGGWAPLPGTQREASAIADLFARAFPSGRARRLADEHAGKVRIAQVAPRSSFIHLATHAYFAPESVNSTADAPSARDEFAESVITGLSPLALCGLALSGANLPPDEFGRLAGILTAEEILSLDLSKCTLVTLSACDTSLGVRRAGQGYASLRAALQGAGARFVLTSLWKVGDEQTMQLMVDFYRRLWAAEKEPHAALWEAKMEARRRGAPFRDWAGWVLTGR